MRKEQSGHDGEGRSLDMRKEGTLYGIQLKGCKETNWAWFQTVGVATR